MLKNSIKLLLALMTFGPFSSFVKANECSSIDLREKFSKPVRNQGKISWCYAFTSADQLEFHEGGPALSAPHIAVEYNRTWPGLTIRNLVRIIDIFRKKDPLKEHETGFIKTALKRAMKVGVCKFDDVPDNFVPRVDLWRNEITLSTVRDAIIDINNNIAKRLKRESINDIGHYYSWGNISPEEFERIVKKEKVGKITLNLFRKACENKRVTFKKNKYKVIQWPRYFNTLGAIDSQLARGNMPAIDYNSNFLTKSKTGSWLNVDGMHTSSIIGRRFNVDNNKCEYLIRNSWGSSCERYRPNLTCEEGNIWVDETTLKKNIILVTYLKEK
jgi:hypothetical protein